jgi:formylglycine-generating enzyme required for sulfatase activity
MRPAVVGAALVLVAAMAGVGGLAWTAFSRSSARTREAARIARAEERAANDRAHPERAGARGRTYGPAAPRDAPWANTDDRGEPRGPDAPGDPDGPGASGPRAGVPSPGSPGGGVEPGPPGSPGGPGAAAARGAPGGGFPPAPVAAGSACPARMADIGPFCIDTTEVTNVMYSPFLAAKPSAALQRAACAWNVDYTPSGGPPASDTRPVVGVDWCDAWLYCAWSGKRLCGHIGGGSNPTGDFADAASSEWYDVCSNGGTSAFAYGDAFDATKCAHGGEDGGAYVHANSIPTCVGTAKPFDAVFDMSGNAGEWEDSCSGEVGAGDVCRVRGGGPPNAPTEGSCAMDELVRRDQASKAVGFRCCADRTPK